MLLSDHINNYHRLSNQIEQAIKKDDTEAVTNLDAELQAEFGAILSFQPREPSAVEELVVLLLERLLPAQLRSPIELQICNKITQVISLR